MSNDSEPLIQYIQLSNAGDAAARRHLFQLANARLAKLAGKMFRGFPGVRRWEETDDLWQTAGLRLWQSLANVQLKDAQHFYSLAALHIRRELIDLTRRYYGPQGLGTHHASTGDCSSESAAPLYEGQDHTLEGQRLAVSTEFHERVAELSDEHREVFDLIWYQGVSQAEAAELLRVSVRTIKRRWQAARLALSERLSHPWPDP